MWLQLRSWVCNPKTTFAGILLLIPLSTAGLPDRGDHIRHVSRWQVSFEQWQVREPLQLQNFRKPVTIAPPTQIYVWRSFSWKNHDYKLIANHLGQSLGFVATETLKSQAVETPLPRLPWLPQSPVALDHKNQNKIDTNTGVKQLNVPHVATPNIALTMDFCPSRKPAELAFLLRLETWAQEHHSQPLPVTLFISRAWLQYKSSARATEIETIQKILDRGTLAIRFGNHSATHPYRPGTAWAHNFLLSPGVDIKTEVLGTEAALFEAHWLPEPWFRFPGLISTESLHQTISESYGLAAIGKGSWPALGERIHSGDIVLIHGNGNEPSGIVKFDRWLKEHSRPTSAPQFMLLPHGFE